jgi:hypothetical protein
LEICNRPSAWIPTCSGEEGVLGATKAALKTLRDRRVDVNILFNGFPTVATN